MTLNCKILCSISLGLITYNEQVIKQKNTYNYRRHNTKFIHVINFDPIYKFGYNCTRFLRGYEYFKGKTYWPYFPWHLGKMLSHDHGSIWSIAHYWFSFQSFSSKFTPNIDLYPTWMNVNSNLWLLTSNVFFWSDVEPDLARYWTKAYFQTLFLKFTAEIPLWPI